MEAATVTTPACAPCAIRALLGVRARRCSNQSLNLYAALALIYLLFPIAIIILFSFNDPQSRFNFTWQGFTLENWKDPFGVPGLREAMVNSLKIAALVDGDRDDPRDDDGARAGALPVPRPRGHEPLHLPPARDARGRARRLAAVAVHRRSATRPASRRS